jgi:hypothetical protein
MTARGDWTKFKSEDGARKGRRYKDDGSHDVHTRATKMFLY